MNISENFPDYLNIWYCKIHNAERANNIDFKSCICPFRIIIYWLIPFDVKNLANSSDSYFKLKF